MNRYAQPVNPIGRKRPVQSRMVPHAETPAAKEKTPIAAVAFIFSLIVPVSFYVGPLRLPPNMILLLLMFVPCFVMWMMGKAGQRLFVDYMIMASAFWSALAFLASTSLANSIEPAGVVLLQTMGAYMLGRTMVRNAAAMMTMLKVYCFVLVILAPFAMYEALTERTLFLDIFRPFGFVFPNLEMDPRMGLNRTQAAFEHPILFGVFCASGFAMAWFGFKNLRLKILSLFSACLIFFMSILSVSTGAALGIGTQLIIMGWGWLFRKQASRWRNLGILVTSMYFAIDTVSNRSPFHVFVDYMTFNSGSAYNRILIWEYGTEQLYKVPVLGLGVHADEWERPVFMSSSMDNFWLVVAVSYGIPGFLFLASGLVWLLFKLGDRRELDQKTSNLRMGVVISLIGLFTSIASVHLWNSTYCWMMFLIGSSVWILEQGRGKKEIMSEIQAKRLEQQRIDRENARKQRLATKGASGV